MNVRSWVFVAVASVVVGTFEATFVTLLPAPWREFRPIIDLTVLLIVIDRPRAALVFAALAGLILDAFGLGNGVFAFARFLLVASAVWALSESVITNRSVYASAALVVGARLINRLWIWIAGLAGTGLFRWEIQQEPLSSLVVTILWDLGTVSFVFMLLAFFTRRFLMSVARPNRFYDRF